MPGGDSHYSAEYGAEIERRDGGFLVSKDGVAFWTPDSNVVSAFPR